MKKLLAIILMLALAFSLAACGGGAREAGGAQPKMPPGMKSTYSPRWAPAGWR